MKGWTSSLRRLISLNRAFIHDTLILISISQTFITKSIFPYEKAER